MTAQPNHGIIFAAPAAIQIRRRPSRPVDVATHTQSPQIGLAAVPMPNSNWCP